ncbi:hypothetical protein D3C76_1291600 [compost metagenome]
MKLQRIQHRGIQSVGRERSNLLEPGFAEIGVRPRVGDREVLHISPEIPGVVFRAERFVNKLAQRIPLARPILAVAVDQIDDRSTLGEGNLEPASAARRPRKTRNRAA